MRAGLTFRNARPVVLACLGLPIVAACNGGADFERVEMRTSGLSASTSSNEAPRFYTLDIRNRAQDVVSTGMGLTLKGTIDAPVLDGQTLQATDVAWVGTRIVASYNTRGPVFAGALQIIDGSDPSAPKVLAEALYRRTDLAKVRISGNRIFAAGADADEGGTLELFSFDDTHVTYDGFVKVGSYSATYLDLKGNEALVSFGDRGGGVSGFDVSRATTPFTRGLSLEDARWVSPLDDDGLLAISGSPGRITRYDNQGGVPSSQSVTIEGASVGAPTWAERRGDALFVSADDGGLLTYDLRTMRLVGRLPTTGNANGSAVATDGRIAFLANGEEGLVVADVVDPSQPRTLATFDVNDSGSANAVALNADAIALADGLGGVKLFHYERSVDKPADCDGDGVPDDVDTDDDDDGVLDVDDYARCNPDVVCRPDQLDRPAHFVGDMYNLPCNHPDVEGPITGVVTGHLPSEYDWFDQKYFAFRIERDTLLMDYAQNYFPVNTGLCDDPYYFAAHWFTTAIATVSGDYTFEMGSDDDSWLFIDGKLVLDIGGIHAIVRQPVKVPLTAGAHRIEIYFAERHKVQSGLVFQATVFPAGGRLEFQQHVCLDRKKDSDGDGVVDERDVAPLVRPSSETE